MPENGAARKVRTSAKSCAECRRRKVKCIYSHAGSGSGRLRSTCDNCIAHARTCVPQVLRSETSSSGRMTARERIGRLEQNMSSLVELLNEKQTATTSSARALGENLITDAAEDLESSLDCPETENATLPSHLRLLFDDFLDESFMTGSDPRQSSQSAKLLTAAKQNARARLQPLLPSRDELSRISPYASDWMDLYYTLFPPSFAYYTRDHLVDNYDHMQHREASPVTLAMYLLSIAITAQQVPTDLLPSTFFKGQSVTRYVDAVCRTVQQTIIDSNALAASPDALETAMLCIRLSMGRGDLDGAWLLHRRIIALAEVIGLPRTNEDISDAFGTSSETQQQRANVWEAICATDRNFSLMLSFPAGTLRYHFPRNDSIFRDGVVSPNAYNYQLSNVCAAIFEIDESYLRKAPHAECYEKVLSADRQLRALAVCTPKSWWQDTETEPLASSLVKFWHHYFLARVHLRPGLMNSSDEQYPYSRSTCQKACRNAVQRFARFRHRVPSGFFVCRVLDVQVFTAATFLLLSEQSGKPDEFLETPQTLVDPRTAGLVQQVIDCFAAVRGKAGSDLAREAEVALTSLLDFVQGQDSTSQPLRLQIPLLGRIELRRRSQRAAIQQDRDMPVANVAAPEDVTQEHQSLPAELDSMFDPILWSFEFSNPSMWMGSNDPIYMPGMDNWISDVSADVNM